MSLQVISSNQQERPRGRDEASKPTGRLRSACDSCHQSKIRCSGGNPCSTCEWSQSRCTYSLANPLGRPKGSKNKRTLTGESSNERNKTQRERASSSAEVVQWESAHQQQQPQQQQQQLPPPPLDAMASEFDYKHGFDAASAESLMADASREFMLDPDLSLMDMMSTGNDLNLQAIFAEVRKPLKRDSECSRG